MRKHEKAMVNFLAQPENLGFAFEIYDLFSDVMDKLIIDFWKDLRDILRKRLSEEGYEQNWVVEEPSDEEEWALHYHGIEIKERNVKQSDKMQSIYFHVLHDKDGIFYGFLWNRELAKKEPLPSPATELVGTLKQEGFKSSPACAAWTQPYRPELKDERGLLAIAEGRKALEIADEFWPFFKKYHEQVSSINRELESGDETAEG